MLETIARVLAANAIGLLMLSVGLRTPRSIVRDLADHWKLLLSALFLVWILVPLVAFAVLFVVRPTDTEALTLMIMAICPGVPMVLFRSKHNYGDPKVSLLVLISTVVTAFVMVPLWAAVLTRLTWLELSVSFRDIAMVLVPTVIVPYAIGRLVVDIFPRAADKLARITNALFLAAAGVLLVAVLVKMVPALRDLSFRAFVAAFLIPFAAAVLGYVTTRGPLDSRVSVSYAAALANPALALSVLAHSYKELQPLPLVLAFLIVRAVALIPFNLWFKHRHREDEPRQRRLEPLVPAHGGVRH